MNRCSCIELRKTKSIYYFELKITIDSTSAHLIVCFFFPRFTQRLDNHERSVFELLGIATRQYSGKYICEYCHLLTSSVKLDPT